MSTKIRVAVLTGFLGAGKTTTLNRMIRHLGSEKCVVIENELGKVSVDHLLVQTVQEEIIALPDGCLCCVVRGDLVKALAQIAERRENRPEWVLIETTGAADPFPIIQTMKSGSLISSYTLDSVLAVVDGPRLAELSKRYAEFDRQIAAADLVYISKEDMLTVEQLSVVERRILTINPQARQQSGSFGEFDFSDVGTGSHLGFRVSGRAIGMSFLRGPEAFQHSQFRSRAFDLTTAVSVGAFDQALSLFLGVFGSEVLRIKGVLRFANDSRHFVVQVVGDMVEVRPTEVAAVGPWTDQAGFFGQLVMIASEETVLDRFSELLLSLSESSSSQTPSHI
jgi:G3E family GTPase